MNEEIKPNKCAEQDCNNKAYGKNNLTPVSFEWLCRKHYYMCVYGITSEYLERKQRNGEIK